MQIAVILHHVVEIESGVRLSDVDASRVLSASDLWLGRLVTDAVWEAFENASAHREIRSVARGVPGKTISGILEVPLALSIRKHSDQLVLWTVDSETVLCVSWECLKVRESVRIR